jgi:hypothetical protein
MCSRYHDALKSVAVKLPFSGKKRKAQSYSWAFTFARSQYQAAGTALWLSGVRLH